MSTIIRLFTRDGFVVGADGRMLSAVDGSVGSDEIQKVFRLRQTVIGSVAGIAGVTLPDGKSFDLSSVLRTAARLVGEEGVSDLHEYAQQIAQQIERVVGGFRSNSIPLSKDRNGTSIFMDRIVAGMPEQETISINLYGQ